MHNRQHLEYEAISQEQVHPLVQILVPCDVSIFQGDYTLKQLSKFMNTKEKLSYIITSTVQSMFPLFCRVFLYMEMEKLERQD